ncbi:hypothetical protein LCGC14_2036350 [marine sediment metagenome]|uniref:JAB domain-containing protein n=1 Tax=marine sediment metagenome TaxID=412755 RepID=A0A0F9ET59_9ZZZZ
MNNPLSLIGDFWTRRRKPLLHQLARMQSSKDEGIALRVERYNWALQQGDVAAISRYRDELEAYLKVVDGSASLLALLQGTASQQTPLPAWEVAPQPAVPAYWISSSTLAQAYQLLTRSMPGADQEPEWMLAVTGLKRDHMRTLEHLMEIQMDTQSAAQASFDMDAFTRMAIKLHKHGQALHAVFHSHRFAGPPNPSATDWRLQERLEEGGYPCIQAVFSEDAQVRFFARKPFQVEVYGKGVESIDQHNHLYRIVYRSTLPDPGHSTPAIERRRDGLRPLPAHSGR